jgi:hypothetical protein
MTYLKLGERTTVLAKERFRGFDTDKPMPDFYGSPEILDAINFFKVYQEKDVALVIAKVLSMKSKPCMLSEGLSESWNRPHNEPRSIAGMDH